jgi:dTDP-glucose pyrophosphorylase
MSKPILVVLAAGMGSRYGGLKQMDAIGPGGEAILDYSVFDALRSGFGKIVMIIRKDIESDFDKFVLSRMTGKFPCERAYQEADSLVPVETLAAARNIGRTKPWGTAHALLCAAPLLDAPVCVINSDDFYSRDAYRAMGEYLAGQQSDAAIVPYPLSQTLSPIGDVTRGVCTEKGGYLASVDETKDIGRRDDGKIYGEGKLLADDCPVSMNFWGYQTSALPLFRAYFDEFIVSEAAKTNPKAECFIPTATDTFIKNGSLRVKALAAQPEWFGVTYKEDKAAAVKRIASLIEQGVYPEKLWK